MPPAVDGGPEGMAAPLLHDGVLLGVIVVNGDEGTSFTDVDVDTLDAFGRHVAGAIANARLYRAERTTNQQFAGLHDAKQEFSWLAAAP